MDMIATGGSCPCGEGGELMAAPRTERRPVLHLHMSFPSMWQLGSADPMRPSISGVAGPRLISRAKTSLLQDQRSRSDWPCRGALMVMEEHRSCYPSVLAEVTEVHSQISVQRNKH